MMKYAYMFLGGVIYMFAALGVIYLGLAISDRTPPVIFESARALSDSVPQGASLSVEFNVYRTRICTVFGDRDVVDSKGERHAINEFTRGLSPFVGRETFRRTITVPQTAALGTAFYEVRLRYYCNPVHRLGFPILVETPPIRFTITPALSLVPWGLPYNDG